VPQKIDAYNKELYIGVQKGPSKMAFVEYQDEPSFASARNKLSHWTGELLPLRKCRGLVREN
jgi:hypothetical protein